MYIMLGLSFCSQGVRVRELVFHNAPPFDDLADAPPFTSFPALLVE